MGSSQISERLNLKTLGQFLQMAPGVVTQVISGGIGLFFLCYKVPYLIPFTVIYMILYFVLCSRFGKRSATIDERHRNWAANYSQKFKDTIVRFEDIHLQGIEGAVLKNLDKSRKWNLKAYINECKLSLAYGNKISILESLYTILTYTISVYLAVEGYITIGDLSMALILNREVKGMTEELEWALSCELPTLVVFVKRIQEMLGYGEQSYGSVESEGDHLIMVLDKIKFAYKKAGKAIKKVLNNISMTLEEGKVYAIVGPSGSGKSTIAKILCRILEPDEGSVKINGVEIKDFTRNQLTELIGMVSQKSLVFMGSIVDQFHYLPEFTWERMEEVCKLAGLYDDIMSHPDGFLAKIGENGINSAGGQVQRLAIAVVLMQNPRIIIMDEATSAQDSSTQNTIYRNLEESGYFKDKILIKIAHRLSTVCHSDRIFVLSDGEFIAEGTHKELTKSCKY
jgi:ABC-type bacteriocin/lantibiotic exporter with double-glycine peptidase domain